MCDHVENGVAFERRIEQFELLLKPLGQVLIDEMNKAVDTPFFLVAGGDFIEPLKGKFDLLRIGKFSSGEFFHQRPFLEKLCARPGARSFFLGGYGGINFAKSRQISPNFSPSTYLLIFNVLVTFPNPKIES